MTCHRGDTREIASSQNIKAMLGNGSQLLSKINAATKIKRKQMRVCLCMRVRWNSNAWTLKNARHTTSAHECIDMHIHISLIHTQTT